MAPTPTSAPEIHGRGFEEGNSTKRSNLVNSHLKDRKLVGIDGKWYDVTKFISRHPGGPAIEHFVGHDATAVFYAHGHRPNLLKHWTPVGTYDRQFHHPADRDFEALSKFFLKRGFFETDWRFYGQRFALCGTLLVVVFLLVSLSEWYWHYIGAVILASFWEQCGYLMHDFMHVQVFRDNKRDRLGGLLFGTTLFGPSSHWWKDDHDVHHSVTNMVDLSRKFVDPQSYETVWAQNQKMFPLFGGCVQRFLIKIQHFTFLPAVTILGRIGILLDSYQAETRWYEWLAISVHWLWVSALLSRLPTWREVFIFYLIASLWQGILHLKLLVSHYSKHFQSKDEFHESSWFVHQLNATININNSPWLDWFYGGLNLHIEHHMFPKMARSRFREASGYIKQICDRHGLRYDSDSFYSAICRTLQGLRDSSVHYSLDPR